MMMHDQLWKDAASRTRRPAPPTSDDWPARALHAPSDFPHEFDVHGHALLRYRFGNLADENVVEARESVTRANEGVAGADERVRSAAAAHEQLMREPEAQRRR